MTLDELIAKLQAAKEHCHSGTDEVLYNDSLPYAINDIVWDSKYIYII